MTATSPDDVPGSATPALVLDARFWSRLAPKYAADPVADLPGYERTLARVAGLLKPADQVVEFGCGTGSTALRLAPGVAGYLATDLSAGMIGIARGKLLEASCRSLRFEVATAEAMAAVAGASGAWDVALGFNWLHLVPDPPAAIRAVRALVRPGGLFVTKTPCLGDMNPLIGLAIPVMRLFGKAPATVRRFGGADLERELVAAGFAIEAVERHGSKGKDARPFVIARAVPVDPPFAGSA